MDNQPPKRSKKLWWILGGIALFLIVVASGSSNTQTPNAVSPSSQTASVAQQVAEPATTPVQPTAQPQIQPTAQPATQQQVETVTQPAPQPTAQSQQTQLSNDNYYTNSDGNTVHSPAYSNNGVPAGATAQCADGTYSFSQHRSGTCSHHGGVAMWLQ